MQWRNADGNTISDDLVQVDRDAVWWFLKDSYWLPGIAPETVDAGIDHSLVFSLLALAGAQAEFARAVTDRPPRARLLEAMVRAVAENGYDAAKVTDAVRLARVSRGTFYELFESKEAYLPAAYRAGSEVLKERIRTAVRDAGDSRDELRVGIRAYLRTLERDPVFARVYLIEARVVWAERQAVLQLFASRYAKTFARSGRPAPPREALYLLAVGVHELACARVRNGESVLDLEDVLVGCAVRLAGEEERWT